MAASPWWQKWRYRPSFHSQVARMNQRATKTHQLLIINTSTPRKITWDLTITLWCTLWERKLIFQTFSWIPFLVFAGVLYFEPIHGRIYLFKFHGSKSLALKMIKMYDWSAKSNLSIWGVIYGHFVTGVLNAFPHWDSPSPNIVSIPWRSVCAWSSHNKFDHFWHAYPSQTSCLFAKLIKLTCRSLATTLW